MYLPSAARSDKCFVVMKYGDICTGIRNSINNKISLNINKAEGPGLV
jgi:hypothetical protein